MSPRMAQLLRFLDSHQRDHGVIPTYRECMEHMALTSTSGIHRLMLSLEARRYIRRDKGRWRAVAILKPPAPRVRYFRVWHPQGGDALLVEMRR